MKTKYALREDGIYSHIVEANDGEFETFADAKKALLSYYRERAEDFKLALIEAKRLRKADVEKEGYFS
jgi:hypothetical protein